MNCVECGQALSAERLAQNPYLKTCGFGCTRTWYLREKRAAESPGKDEEDHGGGEPL